MKPDLHLIAFDVPFPADYGGVMDVYHKLRWLHRSGIRVHLHAFLYRKQPAAELEKRCVKVSYYQRKPMWRSVFQSLPMIVETRMVDDLKNQILSNKAPVLSEGVHCSGFMNIWKNAGIPVYIRTHNIEHQYYKQLAQHDWRKAFYLREEAQRLKNYENQLQAATGIAALSSTDADWFSERYPNTSWIPPFHRHNTIPGTIDFQGNYALYHGNLQIGENHRAAMFLVEKVFSGLKIPLIIAGANPFPALHQTIKQYKHIQLIANPDARKMDKLFHEAGLIVLPAMQRSGIKLKLIDSLMSGKPVLANAAMLAGTGLEMYLPRVETPEEWQNAIRMHFENPAEYRLNQESLKRFENAENIRKLINFLNL